MHSIKYLFGILILHFIYITITRSDVGKYNKAIQHTLVTFCKQITIRGGGGGGIDETEFRFRFAGADSHSFNYILDTLIQK